jgi:hypothetical protein
MIRALIACGHAILRRTAAGTRGRVVADLHLHLLAGNAFSNEKWLVFDGHGPASSQSKDAPTWPHNVIYPWKTFQ